MNTHRTRRWGSLSLLVLTTASVLALLVTPAAAHTLPPPPGPLNGSGNVEGTEAILEENFLGFPCFRNTHTVFALRGAGTYAGVTAGGQPVVYKAEIGPNEKLNEVGPLHVEADTQVTFYHGPQGTYGAEGVNCTGTLGTPVATEFRVFAADHVYNLDGGGAQVPCVGQGVFSRTGATWRGDWSLDQDCIVVGNAAGTPGTGVAPRGSVHTHEGAHEPCSYICPDNVRVDYKQYLAIPGSGITLVGPSNPQVGDTATVTARVTNDGAPVSGVTVDFSNAGPGATSPPSGSAVTGADGRASFSFGGSVVGSYTATATAPSATNPGQFITATHPFAFAPPDPPTVVASGPGTGDTGAQMTVSAQFTDARQPVEGVPINFAVAGPGQATPATGSALTDDEGLASFAFGADRAGDYTVTATADYNGQSPSGTHTVHVDIDTFFRQGALTGDLGEDQFSAAVIDPAGDFAYFGTDTTPGRLVKVDLATFTRVGAITLNTGEDGVRSAVIDPSGQFAYLGTGRGSTPGPARVVKIDLATFTRVGAITLNAAVEFADTEGNLTSAVIDPAGQFAYFGTNFSGAGRVVKIDLATFTRVGAIILEPDERGLNTAVMDPAGAYAYFGAQGPTGLSGAVVKVDLATFTRVDALPMEIHLTSAPKAAVIDPAGQAAYFASTRTLVKIDLATFTRVRDIEFATSPASGVINSTGTRAYFGSGPGERVVEEVDLETFQPARRESMAAGETGLGAGVIAPDDATAYFGTGTAPGIVVKVALQRPPSPALAAGNDTYATNYVTPLSVAAPGVLANDVDTGDGDALVAGQVSDPAGGSVVLNANGSFTYTPDEGFSGVDTFTYTATDAKDYSAPATVSVTVGAAPAGVSAVGGGAMGWYTNVGLFGGPQEVRGGTGSSCGQEGQPACAVGQSPAVSLPLTGGDLAASDPDGNLGQYGPAFIFENHGPIVVSSQGTPGPGGSVTSSALVNNVEDNDPFRVASPDGEISSTCTATESGLSGSTHIVNGSLVTHTDPSTGEAAETVVFDHDWDPAPNTRYDGALDHVGDHWRIVFNEQIFGPDSITVNAMHMYLLGSIAVGDMIIGQSRCSLTADEPNPAPVAADDTYTTPPGQSLVISAPGLLANDADAASAGTLAPIAPPTSGGGEWSFPSDPAHGHLALGADGSFTYTPDAGFSGTDTFTYLTHDVRGKADTGQVTITVTAPQPLAISASPSSVGAGSAVTATWSGITTPSFTDWVGVYASSSAADPALVAWSYTNGTPAGTVDITVPLGSTPATTYELRLFSNNTYTRLATSAPFSVTASATTVSASPASVNPGGSVTATWSGITGPSATDWVGLYPTGATPDAGLLAWAYTSGNAAGAVDLTVPAGAALGDGYELRLFTNNTYTRLATSAPFSVVASSAAVSASPSSVERGAPVTATWSGVVAPTATDWVGLYPTGATPDPGLVAWAYTAGSAAGSLNLTVPPGAALGSAYELRLFTNNSYVRLATSAPFSVVAAANTPPVAGDDAYSTMAGTPLTVAVPGVLANDSDDVDPVSAGGASDPPHGSVTLNPNGSFTYTNDAGYSGTDTFTYVVDDGHGGTDVGLVTITVTPDGVTMLKDVNPGAGSSTPVASLNTNRHSLKYVEMGGAAYFLSSDPATKGLWKTDGTEVGTVRVKDIAASASSNESSGRLTAIGSTLFFQANDGGTGAELWKSDGTAAGTVLVKDILPGNSGSIPGDMRAFGETLYFSANDGVTGIELWKSDGTAAGTQLVKDVQPGGASSSPAAFTAAGGFVVFRANDGTHGFEPWRTDGTEAGTVLLQDIRTGTNSSLPSSQDGFTPLGGVAMFSAARVEPGSSGAPRSLWRTDGTPSGTVMVKLKLGVDGMFPVGDGTLLFGGYDATSEGELWKTDGTTAGTVFVKEINPTTVNGSDPEIGGSVNADRVLAVRVGGTSYFLAHDGVHGRELWKSDGTAAGTVLVKDINPGIGDSIFGGIIPVALNDNVYFGADDGVHGVELWKSDGTEAGTMLVEEIKPGASIIGPSHLSPVLGTIIFTADDGVRGVEPWRLAPPPQVAAVSASPSTVAPGASVTATWSGITVPTATDWIGLYPTGSTSDPGLLAWAYTGGAPSGSLNLAVPAGAPAGGTYELRLFANNTYTRLATSTPFTVTASAAAISASPGSVTAGTPVTATWSGVAAPTASDWVGLYAASADPDPAIVAWSYTGGAANGSLNLTVPAGSPPGTTYELRLYSNNSYTRLATSAPFTVT